MDLDRLRTATAEDHEAVEGSVPLMGDDLSVEKYVACLRRLHGVVAAWEEYAAEHAPSWFTEAVGGRQRLGLLEDDLAWFGVRAGEDARPSMPVMRGDGGFIGAMYVMEGSTLGGQLIARHLVRVLGLEDGHGNAYFRGHGERTGAMWKEFCQAVRTHVADEETDGAIEGAKTMFGVFGRWMRQGRENQDFFEIPTPAGRRQV